MPQPGPTGQRHYTRSMLDRTLRVTFKNYSTLFLLAAAFSVPASLIYAFFFRNAIAVSELHDTILGFPGKRQVAGVGHQTLITARLVGWGLVVLGVLSLPFLMRAAGRILERDRSGHAPTVWDALTTKPEASTSIGGILAGPLPLAAASIVALVVGVLALFVGLSLSEFLSSGRLWVGVGLARGVAWAAGVPFVLVVGALSSRPSRLTIESSDSAVL
ncbi:MAG: hypothetical protein QOH90_1734 [Actinomycetota bacterium]|nr:hypothetical protein [Actinomycetota bacterium]